MRRSSKIALWSLGGFLLVIAIFTVPIGLFMVSNAVAGLLSAVFDKRPLESEVFGSYTYNANWGQALLKLRSDHSFVEQLTDKNGNSNHVDGKWTSSGRDNSLELTFSSLLSVQDEDHGHKYNISGLPAYKRRLGSVYVLINDDLGEQFTKSK